MATHHGGVGHPGEDRELNSYIEDARGIDIDLNNDNESEQSSDTMVAFGGAAANGHLSDPLPCSQTDLKLLTREISSLWQCIEAGEGQPAEGLDHIDHLERELQNLSLTIRTQTPSTPAPMEPFGEVVCQYTDTLCNTQKQTNLTNSLLQDIAIFNEHNLTKLEEWSTDIETTADLISKSWAKLTKAKSRGLTCTFIMEAISSEKTQDEVKDLLRLKLCNTNIHTYTSCFMDIEQREKETLAVYVYWFKTETKWCNFTNNTATIKIFVKGLKNAHSLAECIYEKDPQTLTDAITEVEKLNTAQQILMQPYSHPHQWIWCPMMKINVSNVRNWNILPDTALTSNVMNAMSTDILSWIALTKYLIQEYQQHITRYMEAAT